MSLGKAGWLACRLFKWLTAWCIHDGSRSLARIKWYVIIYNSTLKNLKRYISMRLYYRKCVSPEMRQALENRSDHRLKCFHETSSPLSLASPPEPGLLPTREEEHLPGSPSPAASPVPLKPMLETITETSLREVVTEIMRTVVSWTYQSKSNELYLKNNNDDT